MKHFGKKILALVLALMCIATVGVVSASAASYKRNSDFGRERSSIQQQAYGNRPASVTITPNSYTAKYELKNRGNAYDRSATIHINMKTGNSYIDLDSSNSKTHQETMNRLNYDSKGRLTSTGFTL
ncbi:MAG: hypothetical protein ACI4CC_04795 [Lachnospiraceae bacterium]